jgi:hypothetical protein
MSESVPPNYTPQSYPTELEDDWRMHMSGDWMYSTKEKVFFHIKTNKVVKVRNYKYVMNYL